MANLIGSAADQVSTNGMLGTAAFLDVDNLLSSPKFAGIMTGGAIDVTGNIKSGGAVVDVVSGLRPSLSVDWTLKPTAAALTAAGWAVARTGEITSFGMPVKAAENLFTRSQDFANAAWTKFAATVGTVTDESGLVGSTVVATAVAGWHSIYSPITNTNIGSANYRIRFLCKAAGYTKAHIGDGSNIRAGAAFDLATGTVIGTGYGAGYVSHNIYAHELGGGLYWCELVMTSNLAGTTWTAAVVGYPDSGATLNSAGASYTGDGINGIEVYAAQMQQGLDGDYIPTTTDPITLYEPQLVTTAANELAYQHNDNGECIGLVQYPADTNLILQSQDLGNASWTKSEVAVTASKCKWSGSVPFWRVAKTSVASSRAARQDVPTSVAAGAKYSVTIALLADQWSGTSVCSIGVTGSANGVTPANADLSAAVLSGPGTLTTISGGVANFSGLSNTLPTVVRVTRTYPLADTVSGVLIYPGSAGSTTIGAATLATRVHLSASPRLMPYIPTTTASATRGTQVLTFEGSAFAAVNNPEQGTLLVKASVEDLVFDAGRQLSQLQTGTAHNSLNRIGLASVGTTSAAQSYVSTFNVTVFNDGNIGSLSTVPKTMAIAFAKNSFTPAMGGVVDVTDTAGDVPPVDKLQIGWTAQTSHAGLIQRTELYPRAMTSTELAAITTPGAL